MSSIIGHAAAALSSADCSASALLCNLVQLEQRSSMKLDGAAEWGIVGDRGQSLLPLNS